MKISRKALFCVVIHFVFFQLCLVTLGEASEDNTSSTSATPTGTDAVATVPISTTDAASSSVAMGDASKSCPSVCICSVFKRGIQLDLGNPGHDLRVRAICRNKRIDNFTQLISDDLPQNTVHL